MKGSLQEKNGKYYAVFRLNGKQKWVNLDMPTKGNNKRKAEKALQEVLYKYSNDDYINNDIMFVDFLKKWVTDIKPTVKPVTWETYNKVVNNKITPYFEPKNYKLKDLKGMQFTEYFIHLKEKDGLQKKTVLNIRGILSSAFGYAIENDLIKYNYVERSRLPLFEQKGKEHTIYTPEQIKAILEYAEKTNSKACLFLYIVLFTGARKGEILGLTWDNIDFENSTIYICQNRTGSTKEVLNTLTTPKSKNGVRTLSIPQKVVSLLKAEKALQAKNKRMLKKQYKTYDYDFVIRQADGSTYNPNSINRIINKLANDIGLPHCTVHDFRHAVASMLFENGVPLADVSTQLGHSQTSTTERIYIHKNNVAKVENMQTLVKVLEKTS